MSILIASSVSEECRGAPHDELGTGLHYRWRIVQGSGTGGAHIVRCVHKCTGLQGTRPAAVQGEILWIMPVNSITALSISQLMHHMGHAFHAVSSPLLVCPLTCVVCGDLCETQFRVW